MMTEIEFRQMSEMGLQQFNRIEKLEQQVNALWQLVQFLYHGHAFSEEELEIYNRLMQTAISGRM
jgi:enoyl-[acyl-carrier-protein] reductase (NADH)